jgi:hypothetical protein
MKKYAHRFLWFALALATSASASVTVNSPWNNSVNGSPVHYVATANAPTCNQGVASMGIYINHVLKYVVNGASLNTKMSLSPGSYNTTVEEWDNCGGASYTAVPITVTNQTGVWVITPANNYSGPSPINYMATSNSANCSKGIASMGIYVNNVLTYTSQGNQLNTSLQLSPGTYNTTVEEWDYCGGASYTYVEITVTGGGGGGSYFDSLQAGPGWVEYGELPPNYNICTNCGPGITYSMQQHIQTPSLSGNSTRFNIGGDKPYSDALFTNPLIGQNSSQGVPDTDHKLLPTLHNFIYDAYFYGTDLDLSQVLEFDVSMYFNGVSLIWGNQCTIAGGHQWDIWDNVTSHWVSTGASCYPISNGWNHLTIQVQRESDNTLLFQSITLNGVKNTLNQYYAPGKAPENWWGITINYQMDGNSQQSAYSTYLDNFTFTYW